MSYVFIITIIYVGVVCIIAVAGETEEATQKRVQLFCPHTYCLRLPTRKGTFLQPSQAEGPLPACYVCGASEIILQVKGRFMGN